MATNTTVVHAGAAQVFAVLSDGWVYSNWVVGTSHMRAVEADWPAVGSRLFHASGAWPFVARDETTVLECEPPSRLVLTAKAHPFGEATITLELTDEAAGCRVVLTETPSAGPGRWFNNPAAEALLVRRNVETLARLAALAERRTTPHDR
ncbi:SRPBCC domain-containing protein [uncultured Jatrophihabitans sp.]|uniref:SRPBCC family protein n=1 Tax=uncultured Jatrophihabitans sp. TaxID=1610747 RepID=UPI0035CAC288